MKKGANTKSDKKLKKAIESDEKSMYKTAFCPVFTCAYTEHNGQPTLFAQELVISDV